MCDLPGFTILALRLLIGDTGLTSTFFNAFIISSSGIIGGKLEMTTLLLLLTRGRILSLASFTVISLFFN